MFIKLPSGKIFKIDNIVSAYWNENNTELNVLTVESDSFWILGGEDAKRLYEYLSSIAMTFEEKK